MGEWVHRLETMRQPGWDIAALRDIVALHYAYRFDPQGITTEQRHELKSCVERWLTNACRHA
jgi:hypothetical protein